MSRVLVLAQDTVGAAMAGPAVRAWEIATQLSTRHEVTLFTPNVTTRSSSAFTLRNARTDSFREVARNQEILIARRITPAVAHFARRQGIRVIFDAYDPVVFELAHAHAQRSVRYQRLSHRRALGETVHSLLVADAVVCANERQRDLWTGALVALGKVGTDQAGRERRVLAEVVPFGLPSAPATRTGDGLRSRLGLGPHDRVVLWGGGIWDWLDPVTPIRAVAEMARRGANLKLVFMGMDHPNDEVRRSRASIDAQAEADRLAVTNRSVFFLDGWVPYSERQNYLLDADVGISHHGLSLEATYSNRTRVLDYLWAGIPVVATRGDEMSALVESSGAGRVVAVHDVPDVVDAFQSLLGDEAAYRRARVAVSRLRSTLTWEVTVAPLMPVIDALVRQPASTRSLRESAVRLRLALATLELLHADGRLGGRLADALRPRSRDARGHRP